MLSGRIAERAPSSCLLDSTCRVSVPDKGLHFGQFLHHFPHSVLQRISKLKWLILIALRQLFKVLWDRDSHSGLVVKTSPSRANGEGSIPSEGAPIPRALWPKKQHIKQKQYSNKFNKDFKMVHVKIYIYIYIFRCEQLEVS